MNKNTMSSKNPWTVFKVMKYFFILIIIQIPNLSFLQAQDFDPALAGSSFALPLQQVDWPMKVGTESQLFIDDNIIHSKEGVVRVFHQPQKYENNPIMEGLANGTIIYVPEEKQYRMYYGMGHRVAYSKDGIHWRKPNLGLISVDGSKENNVIIDYNYPSDLSSFIYDPRDPDPNKRWKATIFYYDKQENPRWSKKGGQYGDRAGLYALFSSDGLHWNTDEAILIIPGRKGKLSGSDWPLTGVDDVSIVTWDERLGKYVAWLKIWDRTNGRYYRARAMAFSDDFIHWSQPWAVMLADKLDPPGLQLYGMVGWPYESMWVGTLRAYHSSTGNHPIDLQLITSRDGIHWERAGNRGAFIPNGPEGSYDHGYHHEFSNPPIRFGDELFFYYASTPYGKAVPIDYERDSRICLAKLRVDGFASLNPNGKNEQSYVITRPLDFTGQDLYLNANAKGGDISVEILHGDQDNDFQPIPGFTLQECTPVNGDGLEQKIRWKKQKDLSSIVGKRVRLKFYLNDKASLYSFSIR